MPADWNGSLVVHAHGGPRLGAPTPDGADEDLVRFAVTVAAGYAWIGSTYRRGGYGVRMAAADVESSRELFVRHFGQPRLTLLHGQSYGGNVAAKLSELNALTEDGRRHYDGVLLTNGILNGGTRAYGFRADLRAVYQLYCGNHPRPDEPQYPLWAGLPTGDSMTRDDLRRRVDDCTGVHLPDRARSPEQQRRLRDILAVTGVDEGELFRHLAWASFNFRDLIAFLGGLNPFDNSGTTYRGSQDDVALNRGVARFRASPDALARLAYDADLTGLIVLPTVTLNALHDPVVASRGAAEYGDVVGRAGRAQLLLRLLTSEDSHSTLSDAGYLAALESLADWAGSGRRPSHASVEARCEAIRRRTGDPCLFVAGD
jgi:hypothetical protein